MVKLPREKQRQAWSSWYYLGSWRDLEKWRLSRIMEHSGEDDDGTRTSREH
jgi:hypothetical protein